MEGYVMSKTITFNMVDSNYQQVQKVQEVFGIDGNQITTTDIINIALREFFNKANVTTDKTAEENIVEALEKYLVI